MGKGSPRLSATSSLGDINSAILGGRGCCSRKTRNREKISVCFCGEQNKPSRKREVSIQVKGTHSSKLCTKPLPTFSQSGQLANIRFPLSHSSTSFSSRRHEELCQYFCIIKKQNLYSDPYNSFAMVLFPSRSHSNHSLHLNTMVFPFNFKT